MMHAGETLPCATPRAWRASSRLASRMAHPMASSSLTGPSRAIRSARVSTGAQRLVAPTARRLPASTPTQGRLAGRRLLTAHGLAVLTAHGLAVLTAHRLTDPRGRDAGLAPDKADMLGVHHAQAVASCLARPARRRTPRRVLAP